MGDAMNGRRDESRLYREDEEKFGVWKYEAECFVIGVTG
jgi:hypothetical protein